MMKKLAGLVLLFQALSMGAVSQPVESSGISGTIVDRQSGVSLPARVYLFRENELFIPPGFSFYDKRGERHFLVPARFDIPLPPGDYRIRVERGKEFYPVEQSFTLAAGQRHELRFELERWINMEVRGWFSGDLHVHRPADAIKEILLVEDVNVAPVINMHVWSDWESLKKPPRLEQPLVKVDEKHVYSLDTYEIERIIQGPGAVMLCGFDWNLDLKIYELYPPSIDFTREVHRQGGYVDGDKLFWLDTPVNVALGEIDFIEIACNHFFPHAVDADIARWAAWQPDRGFEGDKGFALWIMDFYYKFLNCGFHLPVSGGSAAGVKPLPVGYNRVYVKLDRFSWQNFFKALKEGRSFSTNGPMLDLKVNGQGLGSTIDLKENRVIHVEATAEAASELESLELVVNGKVFASVQGRAERRLSLSKDLRPSESIWVAARAFEKSGETVKFGHTSPIYVLRQNRPVRLRSDAEYLLGKVDALIERTRKLEGFKEEAHRERTLEIYEQAREVYLEVLREGH